MARRCFYEQRTLQNHFDNLCFVHYLSARRNFCRNGKIEAVGVYVVGNGADESPKIAKERAKQDAVRIALEKAGVYVESFSEMKNFHLTKDEITVIAGEVIAVESESYDVEILPNEVIRYTATIQAIIDADVLETKIKQLEAGGENFSAESERLRKENERLKTDYERLNEENSSADDTDKVAQFLNDGNDALQAGDYQTAIDNFGKAIALKKDYTDAYYSRAKAYEAAGQYESALNDYTRLIELTNQSADSFYLRGSVYEKLGDFDNALKDFNRALEKAPKEKRILRAKEKLLAAGKIK